MKKIGILTWFHWNNYGTVLQAYALNSYLNQEGYSAQTIRVIPDYSREDITILMQIRRMIKKIFHTRDNVQNTSVENMGNKVELDKDKEFEKFKEENIVFSNLISERNYQKSLKQFDYIIMGSDQIWHPGFFKRMYFGEKISRKKLIAYAPSMGSIADLEIFGRKKEMLRLIRRIPKVAIREKKLAEYLKNRYGICAENVVDPTLLLPPEQWKKMEDPKSKEEFQSKRYLCIYLLERDKRDEKIAYANRLAKEMNLQLIIIPIFTSDYAYQFGTAVEGCGPKEFLTIIENAEIVLTDSFHGLVFCGIFGKRFLIFERACAKDNNQQNERLYNLLVLYGAKECICTQNVEKDLDLIAQMNYSELYPNVQEMIAASKNYLVQALN